MGLKFSVITVVLNDVVGIRATRDSVDTQTNKDLEWIVVDGESTDGTVGEIHASSVPCIWRSQKDRGLYDAMNRGLDKAHGEYVLFMNAGDTFAAPDVLERIDAESHSSGGGWDLIHGDAWERGNDGALWLKKTRPASAVRYGMFTHHQAMLYKRETIGDLRFDLSFRVAADYHFTCNVIRKASRTLAVNFPICIFARGGISHNQRERGRRENWEVQRDVLGLSLGRRVANQCMYRAAGALRSQLRPVYDALRFERARADEVVKTVGATNATGEKERTVRDS